MARKSGRYFCSGHCGRALNRNSFEDADAGLICKRCTRDRKLGRCWNCRKHKATKEWVGESGVFGWAHGTGKQWCECCCLKAQLKYAVDAANRLKKLRSKLRAVQCR